jgi:hypothetical protein
MFLILEADAWAAAPGQIRLHFAGFSLSESRQSSSSRQGGPAYGLRMSTPNEPETAEQASAAAPAAPAPAAPAPAPAPAAQPVVDRSQLPPFNIMAIIAFVGAFIIPVVGIVCGHITLAEYRKGLPERGREYALAGTILGYIFTAIWVVLAIVWIVFAFTHFGHSSIVTPGGGQGGFGGDGFGGGGRNFPIPTPRVTPNGN